MMEVAYIYICFVHSRNLHNLEIVLRILSIPKMHANLEIVNWVYAIHLRVFHDQQRPPMATKTPDGKKNYR